MPPDTSINFKTFDLFQHCVKTQRGARTLQQRGLATAESPWLECHSLFPRMVLWPWQTEQEPSAQGSQQPAEMTGMLGQMPWLQSALERTEWLREPGQ